MSKYQKIKKLSKSETIGKKGNKPIKNKIISSKIILHIKIAIIIIIDLVQISLGHKGILINSECSNNITLKIKGPGFKNVFSTSFSSSVHPDKIYINGNEQTSVNPGYDLNETDNYVKLSWNTEIKDYDDMFNGCSDITEFDFSEFNTTGVTRMYYMFYGCSSLTSLDLSNFDTSLVECIHNLFDGCVKLEYINMKNFKDNSVESGHYSDVFNRVPDNLVICINETNNQKIISQITSKKCYSNDCSDDWKSRQKKVVNNNCISIENCNSSCYDDFLDGIEEDFTSINYDTSNLDSGGEEVFELGLVKVTLTTQKNQKNNINNNVTTIDLGDCEGLLKKLYNLSENDTLYMKKIDVVQKGMKTPKVEYDIYSKLKGPNLVKLNLTICENSEISLSIPISISEDLDKLNSSSGYYNDLCYTTTSESGAYIPLNDRKKEFVDNNQTICQDDCYFSEYNKDIQKANCSCRAKEASPSFSLMNINKTKLYENFMDVKNIANINLLICYDKLFSKKGLESNIGSYIILVIIIFHIVCMILFYIRQYPEIKTKIKDIIYAISNYKLIKHRKKKKKRKTENNDNNTRTKNENNEKKEGKGKDNKNNKANPLRKGKKKKKYKKIEKLIIEQNSNPINFAKNKITSNISENMKIKRNKKIKSKSKSRKKDIKEKIKEIMEYKDDEINILSYKLALQFDKRKYCQYYLSLLKTKHVLIFSFFGSDDYNAKIIKIDLFFIGFTLYYAMNGLFFSDATMHKIYESDGSFDFIYQLPKAIYSSLISIALNSFLKILALSNISISEFKQNKEINTVEKRGKDLNKNLGKKFILYFIISFIFLLFFWYYIAMFDAIYRNTQYHLLKDTLISFALSLIYPFGIYLLPGIFRIQSLKNDKREMLYNISKIFQMF